MAGRAADGNERGAARLAILASFEKQVGWCRALDAPFTASVLSLLAADLAAGTPLDRMIADWPGDPVADALPLRLAGALHALVLSGTAPALAACYPPEPVPDMDRLRTALRDALQVQGREIAARIASPP